jgi:hypothetical protein
MEVGQIPVSLPSLTKINKELKTLIETNTKHYLKEILSEIADKYQLSRNELFLDYLSNLSIETTKAGPKKRIKRKIPIKDRCHALTFTNNQCSRKRKDDNLFCGSHINSRNFGVISDLPE